MTEFSEVRARLQKMAPCLWWKGMIRRGSGSGRRRPYDVVPRVLDKKVSTHLVLRAGLRALVVALDPLLFRPRAQPYRGLRTFPRGAGRTGGYRRQERRGWVTAPDGALACRAPMVCCGAPAPHRGHPYRGGAQHLLAGCRAHLLRGRVGWLVELLDDVLPLAPHPWPRWHLGGAGLQGVRPPPAASRALGTPCQPDPRGAVGLVAFAVRSNRG